MYVEKVKRKKNMFDFFYLPTRFDFNLFLNAEVFYRNYFSIRKDYESKFWLNYKSSSGLVDLAKRKNGLIWVDMLKLRHAMRWIF